VRSLIENEDIRNEDVEKITIWQPSYFAENFIAFPPSSSVDTASSLKYVVGAYMILRKIGVEWYEKYQEIMADPAFKEISGKIEIIKDEGLQALFDKENIVKGKVEIRTRKRVFEKEMRLEELKGNPRNNPMSFEDVKEKFLELAVPVIGEDKCRSFLGSLDKDDPSLSIPELMRSLVL